MDIKKPISNYENEEAILSYILHSPEDIDIVKPQWFLSKHTKVIYKAMCALQKE